MIFFSLLMSMVVVGISTAAPANLEDNISKICGHENVQCCIKSTQFNRPINCSADLEQNVFMAKQIEKIYTKEDPLTNHFDCCCVFLNNTNDEDSQCYSKCSEQMLTPSLPKINRLLNINTCIQNNKLFGCFEKCVNEGNFNFNCGTVDKLAGNQVVLNVQSKRK